MPFEQFHPSNNVPIDRNLQTSIFNKLVKTNQSKQSRPRNHLENMYNDHKSKEAGKQTAFLPFEHVSTNCKYFDNLQAFLPSIGITNLLLLINRNQNPNCLNLTIWKESIRFLTNFCREPIQKRFISEPEQIQPLNRPISTTSNQDHPSKA